MGGYVILDDLDNDGVFSKSVAGSAQTKEIQSSQAFFVETTSNETASLTIGESTKSTTNNLAVFRPASGTTERIRADLYLLNTGNSLVLADAVLAEYNSLFTAAVTNEDALKFTNTNENISMLRNGITLGIERRPLINTNDTLFFKLWKTTQRSYQLQLTPENINYRGLMAFLDDSYLATTTPISLVDKTVVNFAIDANAASAATNRFQIIFRPASVLPVVFSLVKAYKINDAVKVEWQVGNQEDVIKYEVEKSINCINFNRVNVTEKNSNGFYSWTDINAGAGKFFYRIKSIDLTGSIKYSLMVSVVITKSNGDFIVEPNPVKGNIIQLHFANQPAGNYKFDLISNGGQLVYSHISLISSNSTLQLFNTNGVLPAGVYQLKIAGPSNKKAIKKIIIEQ